MPSIIGNKKIVALLESQIKNQSLFHAYLFVGPQSVGKFTLAQNFARAILFNPAPHDNPPSYQPNQTAPQPNPYLNQTASDQNTPTLHQLTRHPDLFLIPEADGPISIQKVREVQQWLSRFPVASDKKVIIFEEAALLTLDAQNALLKTLEEPPSYGVVILIAKKENLLLTILSRCLRLNFQPVSRLEIEAAGFDAFRAHLCRGQVGRLFKKPEIKQRWEETVNLLELWPSLSLKEKMDYTVGLGEDDFFFWLGLLRDLLWFKIDSLLLSAYPPSFLERMNLLAQRYTLRGLYQSISKLQETAFLFSQNINKKLLLENLALYL